MQPCAHRGAVVSLGSLPKTLPGEESLSQRAMPELPGSQTVSEGCAPGAAPWSACSARCRQALEHCTPCPPADNSSPSAGCRTGRRSESCCGRAGDGRRWLSQGRSQGTPGRLDNGAEQTLGDKKGCPRGAGRGAETKGSKKITDGAGRLLAQLGDGGR